MEFKHPNYYKKLRKQYRDSQVVNQVKLSSQSQAPSGKLQASSPKLRKFQATSSKRQAWSSKLQAGSYKLPDSWTRDQEIISPLKKFRGPLTKGLDKDVSVLRMLYVEGNLMGWKFDFFTFGYF